MIYGIWVMIVGFIFAVLASTIDGAPLWLQLATWAMHAVGIVLAGVAENKYDDRLRTLEKKLEDKHETKQDDRLR